MPGWADSVKTSVEMLLSACVTQSHGSGTEGTVVCVGRVSLESVGLFGPGDGFVAGLEVLEELGRGAWAVVYRARRGDVDCALKVLKAPEFDDDRALVAFRREAAMLACATHPGLTRIHEVGSARGRSYLVMELVEGQNLDGLLARGGLDEARVVAIASQVAGALAAAHRVGLVHRDVKPGNIMILPDGRVKVVDFGLARWAAGGEQDAVAGTLSYIAPEQTGMLKRVVDRRSDLYSLGVVLFRSATGRLPFQSPDMGELMRMHTVTPAPDVREVRPELSAGFAAIVAKLLAKDPDDRYQSGEGLVADLARLATDGGEGLFRLGLRDVAAIERVEAPLVGREAELTELLVRWDKARSGQGGVGLVAGAAGAGKSRLVEQLVATARADGAVVLAGRSAPDEVMPLAPLRAAVEQYLEAVDRLAEPARAGAWERVRAAAGPVALLVRTLSPALAGLLGDGPELAEEDRREQFAAAVATFLAGLARRAGGAILYLDDVQWLDGGTRRVLRRLVDDLPEVPLLVVATARDDRVSQAALAAFTADLEPVIDTRVELGRLGDAAVGQVLSAQLGGAVVPAELTAQLAARSGGNPFALGEYLRAAVDAGAIRPSWGVWVLEEGGLDALELPGNVVELILSRVDGLGGESRRVLAAAAAMGMRFRPDRLAEVCELGERQVLEVLRVAEDRRLVGRGDGGVYAFVHDRIREALLVDLDEAALRSLHQRIAGVLQAWPVGGAEQVYAVARHYLRGEVERAPRRVFKACFAAGQLALAEYAPQEALGFLEGADAAAAGAGIDPGSRLHAALGTAYLQENRLNEAEQRLGQALSTEPDRHRRVQLHLLIGDAHHNHSYENDDALAAVRRGLAELGRGLPANPFLLVVSTLGLLLGGVLVHRLRWGFGTASGEQRERYQLESRLNALAAAAAFTGRQQLLMVCLILRQVYPANRLGFSPEYGRAYTQLAGALRMVGLRRRSDRLFQWARRAAAGDPQAVVYCGYAEGIVRCEQEGSHDADAREILRRLLTEHRRWLDAPQRVTATARLCTSLTYCGYPREAQAWYERANALMTDHELARSHIRFLLAGVIGRAMLGRGGEVAAQLHAVRSVLAEQPDNRQIQISYTANAVIAAVEQDQLGNEFETLAAEVRRLHLSPRRMWPLERALWASLAQGRLAQCLAASDEERPARLVTARLAIRQLRRAATTPFLRAHYVIAQAAYDQLTGEHHGALRRLDRAERIVRELDAPILLYEIARVRARALQALGHAAEARRGPASPCCWRPRTGGNTECGGSAPSSS